MLREPGRIREPVRSGVEPGRLQFGRLEPGYTASLTVLNLDRPTTIRREDLKTKCGWSPFEGVTFPGSVEAVFLRGQFRPLVAM